MLTFTVIIFTLTIIPQIIAEETYCHKDDHLYLDQPCRHEEAGKQIQCIGAQLTIARITEFEAEQMLNAVISKFHSDKTYYSLGLEVGTQTAIVLTKQTHYTFDQALAIKLNPYSYNNKLIMHVYDADIDRPFFIFTDSQIDTDIFPKTALKFNVPRGAGRTSIVYSLPQTTLEQLEKGTDPCDKFSRWNQLVQLVEYHHIAIKLPMSLYCKHTVHTYAEVVIGDFDIMEVQRGVQTQRYLRSKWHISPKSKRGPVPPQLEADFQ